MTNNSMFKDLLPWLFPILLVAALVLFKMISQVPRGEVAGLLAEGAVVVDVREPGEFSSDHLDGAVNLPLGTLEETISRTLPDKNKPLLLHCLSGTRSAMAVRKLKSLGYTRVHNLGSISRARAVLRDSGDR
jgi:phage shock protein E